MGDGITSFPDLEKQDMLVDHLGRVNNYIVRSYIDAIVATNIVTRRTNKAFIKIQKTLLNNKK